MRIRFVFVALACACALCFGLVGCGGANGFGGAQGQAAIAGTWNLVEMSDGGDVTGTDELKVMNSLGMEVTLTLNKDGKLVLDRFGKKSEGTWKTSSETEGTATLEDQEMPLKITDGMLVLEQGGDQLVFAKVAEASDEAASSGAESSGSSQSADSGSADSSGSSGSSGSADSSGSSAASASADSKSAASSDASAEASSKSGSAASADSASSAAAK